MSAPATTAAVGASTQLALAETARAVQLTLRARLMRDVTKLWPMLDAKRLPETFPAWVQAMMLITRNYHGQSAEAAGRFYQSARTEALDAPTPRSVVRFATPPGDPWMRTAFGYAGPGMLSRDTVRPGTALTTTLGTASRIALDGGRATVLDTAHADKTAVGWYRVASPRCCPFCALLASRGVVYYKDSFAKSNARFIGAGEFKVHNNCGCMLAPAFNHDHEIPDVSQKAQDIYYDSTRDLKGPRNFKPVMNAHRTTVDGKTVLEPGFRKAWETHVASLSE